MQKRLNNLKVYNGGEPFYRVSENEGQTEKGYKTLKIGGLDHLFGISVIYT